MQLQDATLYLIALYYYILLDTVICFKTYLYDTDLSHALQYYIVLGYFGKYCIVVKHVKIVVSYFQEHFLNEGMYLSCQDYLYRQN